MSRTRYVMELESVRRHLIQMGETAANLFGIALRGVIEPHYDSLAKASELESQPIISIG